MRSFYEELTTVTKTIDHRFTLEQDHYWITCRSFSPSTRVLLEVCCPKTLPKEASLTEEQLEALGKMGFQSRRQGYSLGTLYTVHNEADFHQLHTQLQQAAELIFSSDKDFSLSLAPSPSFNLFNRKLVGQMKDIARTRDHQLRLHMYTTLLDSEVIALTNTDGSLKACDRIANFDCFGVFTDEKHALQYDPRAKGLVVMEFAEVLRKAHQQNAGSLWLNPKGETRGELYRNELDSLRARLRET